jgi:two-component system CheB/CheR fusion protein
VPDIEREPVEGSFPIVGIGASAGGLEAYMQLLQALPERTGMAFVLVQHLDPKNVSKLANLLAPCSRMPVLEAAHDLSLQPDHVYVIAPDTTLRLAGQGVLQVEPRREVSGPHLPIDIFFRSLAEQRASGAIGVVLSGTGSDGTLGLEEIKAAGGITLAQDEASARYPTMPQSAVRSGCVDLVLPPDGIAAELARIGEHPYVASPASGGERAGPAADDEEQFKAVLALLHSSSKVDFSSYRDSMIRRRILRRMALHSHDGLARYVAQLKADRPELDALYQDVLINVTSFFREPAVFESLKTRVFPSILEAKSAGAPIRLWVPGCSTGQEAYSLGIALLECLDERPLRPQIQIFATDLSDSASLNKAREGLYPESIETEVTPERLRRFFTTEDGHYRVSNTLREMVVFARQNVAADPPFSRVDLISCRNLLMYLGAALQQRVIPTFHYALNPGGFLLLGASETVGAYTDLFAVVDQPHRIYKRKTTAARRYPHFRADEFQGPLARAGAAPPPRPAPADWLREADRVAAGRYVPPGVLINEDFDILQFRGQAGPFLAPAPGEPSHNLLKMAREGLFMALRTAVQECQRTGAGVSRPGVRVRGESVDREIELQVLPIKLPQVGERCYLILFEEQAARAVRPAPAQPPQPADADELQHLRQELAATQEYLQSVIEQQDAANEELKSASEEVLSSNEELQSTNEELETAKEELQSVNEELITVNEQLQHRNTELSRLNDDLTNVFASSGVPTVVLGIDLRIRRFTPAAAKLFELRAGDVGRPAGKLLSNIDMTKLDELVGEVVASVQTLEREVRADDGRCWLLRVAPYRTTDNRIDGAVLMLLDIDDLRRLETAVRDERDYANAIVETVREPLLVLDGSLAVRSANRAFYAMFEVTPAETLGRPVVEIGNRQWDIPALREQLGRVLSLDRPFADFDIRHDFERIGLKVMRLNARRIVREDAHEELILLAIEDHTELTRLERQAELHVARLVHDNSQKMTFLALLAHELRNPLAPIRNGLHILERTGNQDEQPRRVRGIIERQVQQLTRLVDDLLDVARIERGRVEVQKQRIDLGVVVRDAVETGRSLCDSKGVELSASVPDAPLWLDGDATRLAQAVGNVLNNAAKFTESGGRIEVSLRRDGEEAAIRVRDSGIGIAADVLPHVFDMFMQVDSSLERSRSGLGIGLTLVRQLIQAHGGSVSAYSAGIGQGSEFELRLPLACDATGPARAEAPADWPAKVPRRRILVADDNRDAAESLAEVLKQDGHEVSIAHDGPAALSLAETWQPDVVLLDIGMPGMNGYEVARRIRKQPGGHAIVLAALTGWGQPKDHQLSADAGFDAHLVKPVHHQTLAQLLARAARSGA